MTADYFAVFVFAFDHRTGRKQWEPMDYGQGDEPDHTMLLRRSRIALFPSQEAAEAALKDTLRRAKAAGHKWPTTHTFTIQRAMVREPVVVGETEAAGA